MRIIAGSLRGRRLKSPRGRQTRPTPARVREALFAALEPIAGLRVLDLYAGSGALAIEALSRGAAHAVLVERARPAVATLRDNLHELGLTSCTELLAANVARVTEPVLERGPYDLIMADPPYADVASGTVAAALARLVSQPRLLCARGRLVLEHASRDAAPALAALELDWTRTYGDTAVSLYVRASAHGGAKDT